MTGTHPKNESQSSKTDKCLICETRICKDEDLLLCSC